MRSVPSARLTPAIASGRSEGRSPVTRSCADPIPSRSSKTSTSIATLSFALKPSSTSSRSQARSSLLSRPAMARSTSATRPSRSPFPCMVLSPSLPLSLLPRARTDVTVLIFECWRASPSSSAETVKSAPAGLSVSQTKFAREPGRAATRSGREALRARE